MRKPKRKRTVPIIGKIARLQLRNGDTIVLFSKLAVPHAQQVRIFSLLRGLYPTSPVLIFEEGMQMSVVSPQREATA